MKRPSISFDKDAIVEFLLAHGEKIGVAVVAALACGLVWGGVSAARSKTASREQQPAVIEEQANLEIRQATVARVLTRGPRVLGDRICRHRAVD